MKQVVVRKRIAGLAVQAANVHEVGRRETRRQPRDHRHMRLRGGRDRIRQSVQVQAVLAERFAMVGDIDHRGVQRFGSAKCLHDTRSTWSV